MVKEEAWEQAWCGGRKSFHGKVPGQEILCIGCLEQRIGRTLMACDFTDAPVNDPNDNEMSARLCGRITAQEGTVRDAFTWLAWGQIKNFPPAERERLWRSWCDKHKRGAP